MQDWLDINEKSINQFKNRLIQIKRIQWQRKTFSEAEKIYLKILKDIFNNKIKYIKKKSDILKNALVNVQKRKILFEKGLKKIAKIQNLSRNEFNQILFMHGLSRDELEQIAKKKRN